MNKTTKSIILASFLGLAALTSKQVLFSAQNDRDRDNVSLKAAASLGIDVQEAKGKVANLSADHVRKVNDIVDMMKQKAQGKKDRIKQKLRGYNKQQTEKAIDLIHSTMQARQDTLSLDETEQLIDAAVK